MPVVQKRSSTKTDPPKPVLHSSLKNRAGICEVFAVHYPDQLSSFLLIKDYVKVVDFIEEMATSL
jgi:hypothetical protein